MLSGCAGEIVVGDHESPRIKMKLPPTMKWLLARNRGENLSSTFACVVEACPDAPAIQDVERLATTSTANNRRKTGPRPTTGDEPVAMRVTTARFRDTILSDETGAEAVQVEGFGEFKGRWAFVRTDERGVSKASLVKGERLYAGEVAVETAASWDGTVTAVDIESNRLDVGVPLPLGEALKGQWMVIYNNRHGTCYEIERVEATREGSRIQLAEITPMVGKGYVDRIDEDQRIIHTDTRWRVYGKDDIWSGDFGPALSGYALINEDLSQSFDIEDCKLMPSRARAWWKPEAAWIKLGGDGPIQPAFNDTDGDGRVGFWVYDFRKGSSFTIANGLALDRIGPNLWAFAHCGGGATLTLPAEREIPHVLIRAAGGDVQEIGCRCDPAAKTATVRLPDGLKSPVAVATRSAEGVDLTDTDPPAVREVRVNGEAYEDEQVIELFVSEPPKSVEIVVEDAKNAIDVASVCVEAGHRIAYAREPGVSVTPDKDSPRRAEIRVEPEELIAFQRRDVPAQYTLTVTIDDVAVDDHRTMREFRMILGPHIPEGSVYLSDLDPIKAFAHAGLKRDTNYLGGEVRLGGAIYHKSVMICPERTDGPVNYGEAIYEIPRGQFKTFRAVIGIEDSAGGGSVMFAVYLGEGGERQERKPVFQSGVIHKGDQPQSIAIPLGDATAIHLYTDADGSIDCDHALFAAARFEP
jgi:hypothetical protein